jgi:hypothetical protein
MNTLSPMLVTPLGILTAVAPCSSTAVNVPPWIVNVGAAFKPNIGNRAENAMRRYLITV